MANNLTGNYDAVLQVSIQQINGLLATMHQAGVDKNISPSFPHSIHIQVSDPLSSVAYEVSRFRQWVAYAVEGFHQTAPSFEQARTMTASVEQARALLSKKTPPGVAVKFEQAWHDLDSSAFQPAPDGVVRGRADAQVSAPRITVAPGSASEVTVRAWVRARFFPDTTTTLPAPIHGELRALYFIRPRVLPDGRKVLRVEVTSDDNKIQFVAAPGSGLTGADEQAIASRLRTVVRAQFGQREVNVPADLKFSEFTALGSGPTQALVLPFQLSDATPPPGSLSSVTAHLLGSNEFAIAVSKDYVQRFFDTLTHTIKSHAAAIQITLSGLLGTAHYTPTVTVYPVVWKAGSIEISGRIDARSNKWWAPSGWVTFTQAFSVALDVPSQTVAIGAVGDPDVKESWFISHDKALNNVKSARDQALPGASAALNKTFQQALDGLDSTLKSFDQSGFTRYAAVEIRPDGLIARGQIGTNARLNPIVHFDWTDGGTAFTAFQSWIPGGRIKRFHWTWVERTQLINFFNKTQAVDVEHEYVFAKPADVYDISNICLVVEGTRLSRDGKEEEVSGGKACTNSSHEPICVHPSWWMKLNVPVWLPRWPDRVVSDLAAAHVNLMGRNRRPGSITTNVLVHFTGSRVDRPLDGLSEVLSQARRDLSLLTILVLPQGAFEQRLSALEATLGSASERSSHAHLEITEDYVGGWSETFGAREGPSTHLINARGEFVWQQDGRLDAAAIVRALSEHALDAPPPLRVPMQLTVQAGEPALDAVFPDDLGNVHMLRRLRGRQVMINFWQSWAAPSMRELRHLQNLHAERNGPFILAVNSGEGPNVLADVRKREGLTFPLVSDSHQTISALYGVQCWPTSVFINEVGIVERIQFGLTHEHRPNDRIADMSATS
jgi:peroxiredoxin